MHALPCTGGRTGLLSSHGHRQQQRRVGGSQCLRGRQGLSPCRAAAAVQPTQVYAAQHHSPQVQYAVSSYEDDDLGWRTDYARHYVQGTMIGQGSFGRVFRSVELHTGREVAVKIMPKLRGKLSKEATLGKLAREVDILERLQGTCGGAIQLYDVFEDAQDVLLVTELCGGGDLQAYSEAHGALNERALAHVALEVLKIVRACHQAGLLHGDVKPANFCLKHQQNNPLASPHMDFSDYYTSSSLSWIRAIDFGCSQLLPAHRRLSKRTGTPVYMAPEIYQRDYHEEADMWSVGVMLYQLYARRFPFWPDMESCKASKLEEVAQAVTSAPITFDYGPWLTMSQEGREFISQCLQREPSERLTVHAALQHPWLKKQLFDAPRPAAAAAGQQGANNVVKARMQVPAAA